MPIPEELLEQLSDVLVAPRCLNPPRCCPFSPDAFCHVFWLQQHQVTLWFSAERRVFAPRRCRARGGSMRRRRRSSATQRLRPPPSLCIPRPPATSRSRTYNRRCRCLGRPPSTAIRTPTCTPPPGTHTSTSPRTSSRPRTSRCKPPTADCTPRWVRLAKVDLLKAIMGPCPAWVGRGWGRGSVPRRLPRACRSE